MRNKNLLLILLLALLAPWAANAQDPCAITVFPWTEDFEVFEASTVPDCWDNTTSTSSSLSNHPDYVWGIYNYHNSSTSEDNKMIRMWNWVVREGTAAINSPEIILPPEGDYQLAFNYSHLADCGAFKVRISTDGGTTFADLQEYANTTGSYNHFPGAFTQAGPISLAEYAGQTVVLQFFANATYSEGAIFVDDVTIELAPCLPPTGLTVTQTITGFHFAWDGETDMTYGYSWGLAGEGHGASLYTGNSGHNNYIDLPFTQFNPNADYVFYVFKACTADDWSDEATIGFHTPCDAITVFPWTEDFEVFEASTLPDCWDNTASTSSSLSNHPDYIWGIYNYHNSSTSEDNKMIRMWNWVVREGTAAINSPEIILPPEGDYQLAFNYSHLADCGAFKVRISNDGGTTFTDLQEYANTTGSYNHFPGAFTQAGPISLAEYAGQTVILQFFANATYSEGAIFVDDVTIELAPCLPPTGLTVTQASTGFHFAWDGETGVTYGYSWGLAGEAHGASLYTGNNGHNNYIDLPFTQFNPNADYVFYVFKACTADDWSDDATIGFHTPCDAVATFPWTEDFQGFTVGVVPECWDNSASTSSSLSEHHEHIWGVYHYDYYNSDENQMIRMWNYGVYEGTALINSPEISLPSDGYDYQLTFKYSHRADCGPLEVRISADGGTTFTDVQEYASTDSYDPYDPGTFIQVAPISLAAYSGQTVVLQFFANANYGHGAIFVDDVVVEPACLEPAGLTVTQTSTGFHFAWDGQSGATYGYSWGLVGEGHGASLYTGNSGHNNYIDLPFTQFNPNADYVFYVFKACTADDWSDDATIGFHTPCDAVTTIPWTEEFEDFEANTVPECWDNTASTSTTLSNHPEYIWGIYNYNNGENKMMAMRNVVVESGTALINSPRISLPSEGEYQFTFKYSHRADCGPFKVRISMDGGTTFADLQEYDNITGSNGFAPGTFTQVDPISLADYAGQTVILQFFATANHHAGAIFVDDVTIEPAPCLPPTGLTATSTATGFRFTWDAEQGAYWSYSLSLDGEQPGTPLATGSDGSNNYMDINVGQSYCGVYVDYNTDYTFYVFRNCGGDNLSDYVSVDFMAPIIIKAFTTAGYWNDADNWSPSGVPALLEDVVIRANAIIPNGCVATANSITYDGAPMPITIADGGQLIHKNDGVIAIVEKEITGYTGERDHYYLIGVPQYDQTLIAPTNVQHMLDNDFDLYAFEQDAADGLEWRNYKVAEQPFFLYYGVGYLYANSEDVTLSAETILQPLNDEGYAVCNNYVALSYTNGGTNPLNGWNLVSNPWAFSGYMYVYDPINDEFVSQDFYRMGENGIETTASQGIVAPWEAVFVKATGENQYAVVYKDPIELNAKALDVKTIQNVVPLLPSHNLSTHQDALFAQIISLATGWNWWAPVVRISAAQLSEALDECLQQILSKEGAIAHESEADLLPGQMYKLQTNSQVEDVTVTGERVPDSFNFEPGSTNWIGYTGETTDDIAGALASYGITPANGDKIISQDGGFAVYSSGNGWQGTLTSLTRGQGYVYVSNVQ